MLNKINSNYSGTHFRSDSHVVDAKFDSDDKSSLLVKCQRAHTVPDFVIFRFFFWFRVLDTSGKYDGR